MPYDKPTEAVLAKTWLVLTERGWSRQDIETIVDAFQNSPAHRLDWYFFLKEEHGWTITPSQAADVQKALDTAGWQYTNTYVCHFPSETGLMPDKYAQPIEELGLSMSACNALKKSGLVTIGQVLERSEDQLLSLCDFGREGYRELRQKLDELGILTE